MYLETSQITKIEGFVKIVCGLKPVTIFINWPILNFDRVVKTPQMTTPSFVGLSG